ncbi:hypothetical protein F4824DRAFT_475976 [Ustulina deusta]|nr:hypothetical protein F4824DRAFT_475976 [Ustulina deusta]
MIPILCKVHDSSGRLSRGTHVSLRYGGVAWHALTSPRGIIETWYFDKVVAEDMDLKCSITIKHEESYGHDLITYFFSAPRTEIHLVILCLGSNCGTSGFRLISKPLGSTHALLLRSSLSTQGAGPILTKIDKVKRKQSFQCDTETSQTLNFGSGGSFSSSSFQGRAGSSGTVTSAASGGLFGSASSSNLSAENQPRLGVAAVSSSSGGLPRSTNSSNLLTGGQPRSHNAAASTLSGGGRFGLGSASSG